MIVTPCQNAIPPNHAMQYIQGFYSSAAIPHPHDGCSYALLITLENCSILTFSLTIVPFASFSLFRGTLMTVPAISHPQTEVTNLSNASLVKPSHDSNTGRSISLTDCEIVSAILTRMSSSKPATSAMRSAYRSSLSRVAQKAAYEA